MTCPPRADALATSLTTSDDVTCRVLKSLPVGLWRLCTKSVRERFQETFIRCCGWPGHLSEWRVHLSARRDSVQPSDHLRARLAQESIRLNFCRAKIADFFSRLPFIQSIAFLRLSNSVLMACGTAAPAYFSPFSALALCVCKRHSNR
jgi:hypothetical protein